MRARKWQFIFIFIRFFKIHTNTIFWIWPRMCPSQTYLTFTSSSAHQFHSLVPSGSVLVDTSICNFLTGGSLNGKVILYFYMGMPKSLLATSLSSHVCAVVLAHIDLTCPYHPRYRVHIMGYVIYNHELHKCV